MYLRNSDIRQKVDTIWLRQAAKNNSIWHSYLVFCSVVFAVLLIIIIKQIVFFWYDCYRRWQGKETQRRSQVFYSGRHVTVLTPLPRTGMFSKNWRAILDEVVRPEAPHWMNPQNLTSPSNNDTFLQNSTLKRACPIIDWWSEISKLLL